MNSLSNQPSAMHNQAITGGKTYKIERHKQHLIRKELAVLGIDYSVLFPGIDGVCKNINDRLIFELEMEALPF